MNICEHLAVTARLFPDRDAVCFEGDRFTYRQLDDWSAAAAEYLRRKGCQPGDRVALMLANVPAFVVWYYAALRTGAVAVSVSTRMTPSEVAFLVEDCEATTIVADAETLDGLWAALPECVRTGVATSTIGNDVRGDALPQADDDRWHDAHPDDPALILYTSGTTGFAKGATLSHANVRSNVHAFNHLCDMRTEDRILLAVPLFHCFGQNALLNSALNVGATLVLQRRFELTESKRLIEDQGVTQLYGVPMMFQVFLEHCDPEDLRSVRYCFSAAATLPIQVSLKWQEKFGLPIHEGYGLTETSPFASYNHRLKYIPGSIGTAIDNVEMRIVDTDTGQPCADGELGEIAIRGPNVMLGYWNRQHDTDAAIRDGWFHSGDIGRRDERGFFYIVDRVKDMIAVGGLKVYPAEVERVLLDADGVFQVAVVGMPDQLTGEKVVAFVVLDEGVNDNAAVLAKIQAHSKLHLADYKVPRAIVPLEELPRNPSGKILKKELRKQDLSHAQSTDASAGEAPLREPTLQKQLTATHLSERPRVATEFLRDLVQEITQSDDQPEADDRFIDAGMDSLMLVDLGRQLQAEVGDRMEIGATMLFDFPRIGDLAAHLVEVFAVDDNAPISSESSSAESANRESEQRKKLQQEIESMSEEEAEAELMRELER